MKGATRVIVLAGLALLCAPAQSQTMYRCGKVYQDRPCDAGQKGKAIGSTGVDSQARSAGGGDADCAQRGKDALKIVWSREGGATLERLLSEAPTAAQKRLVQDVYRRPGAASTVQAAVQADCVAEKERLEREAALAAAEAAIRAREGGLPASPAMQYGVPSAPDPQAEARRRAEREAAEAQRKKTLCAQYNAQMHGLRDRERRGGSASTMESLSQSRRDLRDRMSEAGC
jgi:hypothetical protein